MPTPTRLRPIRCAPPARSTCSLAAHVLVVMAFVALPLFAQPANPFGRQDFKAQVTEQDQRPEVILSAAIDRPSIPPGGLGVIAVVFDLAPGWHVNLNQPVVPPAMTGFVPVPTDIRQIDQPLVVSGPIQWPKPYTVTVSFTGEPVEYKVYKGRAIAYVPVAVSEDASPGSTLDVTFTVTQQACDDTLCLAPEDTDLTVSIQVAEPAALALPLPSKLFVGDFADFDADVFANAPTWRVASQTIAPPSAPDASPAGSLFGFSLGSGLVPLAILAAIGGLILNLTPCVLPVIPIKILTLTQHTGGHRGHTLKLGLAMFLGVTSFWAALGIPAALLTAFADPSRIFGYWFVTAPMGILMVLLAFGLMGLFSITLPQAAYAINPKADNAAGSFLFGVMTGVLGLPCFGFVAGALIPAAAVLGTVGVITVFTAMGVGMAAPYLVLAAFPKLVERVPRTGPASELVKQVLGLILAGFGVFFFGTGVRALVATYPYTEASLHIYALTSLVIAAGLWLTYKTIQITRKPVPLTIFGLTGLLLAASAVWLSVSSTQGHRADYLERRAAMADAGPGGILPTVWNTYTPALLEKALDEQKIAFIDFTADWCINCKVFEAQVLDKDPVRSLLRTDEIAMIKVDLTGTNPDGDALLAELGRVGIPTWAVMGPGLDQPRIISTYTPLAVLDAIEAARGSRVTDARP